MSEIKNSISDIEINDYSRINLENEWDTFDIEQIIGETLEENEIFEELVSKIAKGIHDSI